MPQGFALDFAGACVSDVGILVCPTIRLSLSAVSWDAIFSIFYSVCWVCGIELGHRKAQSHDSSQTLFFEVWEFGNCFLFPVLWDNRKQERELLDHIFLTASS